LSNANGSLDVLPVDQRRRERMRALRRRRIRRGGRRAYIRSVQFLPSMATLGNALCGFAAIYIATLAPGVVQSDPVTAFLADNRFIAAVYLVGLAMVFDALDGRLARLARHTTDFGGQLDSLADTISFGVAPAVIALQTFKFDGIEVPLVLDRLIWAIGALYVACTLIRLARFNVSNEHGEESHRSFLGLPSPGAAGAVLGLVLMQQDLLLESAAATPGWWQSTLAWLAVAATAALPIVVGACAVLMVSDLRYPHLVNRSTRGSKSINKLLVAICLVLVLVVAHRYTLGVVGLAFAFAGPVAWLLRRARK
jgi:CDP-diacylglycerol--serine O-phosphatidyltransferase